MTGRKVISRHRFALLLVLLLIGCVQSVAAATRILTDADNGAKVTLRKGDQLELRLASNPSTGYEWSVHPQSTPLLKLISQSLQPSQLPGVGRPGIQVFHFQAVAKGEGVLLLHYVRSWEKPTADERQFSIRVAVR